jgi:alginate production protein
MSRTKAGVISVVMSAIFSGALAADQQADSGPGEAGAEARLEPAAAGGLGLRLSSTGGKPGAGSPALRPPRITLYGVDHDMPSTSAPSLYTDTRVAQFQLPPTAPRPGVGPAKQEARGIPKDLSFQYAFGTDSEVTYLRNSDLDRTVRDNLMFAAPTGFLLTTFRPNKWFEFNFEATYEHQIRIHEEPVTQLPNGDLLPAEKRTGSLLIDQANVVIRNIPDHPLEITLGRRNFEDPRLFLYDAALDGVHLNYLGPSFNTELSVTREVLWDLDLLRNVQKTTVKNYIFYHEYRGIEDHKLAAYAIARLDRLPVEGRAKLYGVRAFGRPSDEFNYWSELGVARGLDETGQSLRGKAFDFGGTYRFPAAPFAPCFTLGVAYGSGDGDDTDNVNRQYRQTGLQSNETRFCGVTQFKRYGEFADPELANLRIHTLGFGFRAAPGIFVDLVYQRYKLNHIANEFRSSGITAEMNQIDDRLSRRVGRELDIIVGFRNLFNSRLGFEARAGVFFPGDAYLKNDGTPAIPQFRKPDKGISVLAVIIY